MADPGGKVALITGISGQDGSYLAELLLEKGYVVHGIIRKASYTNTARISHLIKDKHSTETRLFLHYADLTDTHSLVSVLKKTRPAEIYNLAAQSHVRVSFDMPEFTAQADAVGVLRLLDAIRLCGLEKTTKFYQASTSEMYGGIQHEKQNETTPFHPRSPYAISKVFAYWTVVNYREAYGIYAVNGILFNHESPRRGLEFVTRKITYTVSRIKLGLEDCLYLGNLEAKRDWGHAKEYVEAMWMMMQLNTPTDIVVATGETYTVRQFVEYAFEAVKMPIEWRGTGENETGVHNGKVVVKIDPEYFRPTEVEFLCGDASLAKRLLGWEPKIGIKDLVQQMVDADLALNTSGSRLDFHIVD